MPDQFDRHRPDPGGWGGQPPRSQARAAAVAAEESGRKWKNTRTPKPECTASPDRLHHGEPRLPVGYGTRKKPATQLVCQWVVSIWREPDDNNFLRWSCHHMEYCVHCGNKMADRMSRLCPDYPGSELQKKLARERGVARRAELAAAPIPAWKKRKVPNGPQGYRKKKGGA